MARFHGPQRRGATREQRDRRRIAADIRNALSTAARRQQNCDAAAVRATARLAALTPRLADLHDPHAPYPASIGVYCDTCGTQHVADYLVAADSTRVQRFDIARAHLRTQGWTISDDGDYCPACADAKQAGDR